MSGECNFDNMATFWMHFWRRHTISHNNCQSLWIILDGVALLSKALESFIDSAALQSPKKAAGLSNAEVCF